MYSGRGIAASSPYAGGTSARLCLRRSWRLSWVPGDAVWPKKSSKGSLRRGSEEARALWVMTGVGSAMPFAVEVEASVVVNVCDMVVRCNPNGGNSWDCCVREHPSNERPYYIS